MPAWYLLPEIANPLKPTARTKKEIAIPLVWEYPTTNRSVASIPKPEAHCCKHTCYIWISICCSVLKESAVNIRTSAVINTSNNGHRIFVRTPTGGTNLAPAPWWWACHRKDRRPPTLKDSENSVSAFKHNKKKDSNSVGLHLYLNPEEIHTDEETTYYLYPESPAGGWTHDLSATVLQKGQSPLVACSCHWAQAQSSAHKSRL